MYRSSAILGLLKQEGEQACAETRAVRVTSSHATHAKDALGAD
jgi:hypothetical protein